MIRYRYETHSPDIDLLDFICYAYDNATKNNKIAHTTNKPQVKNVMFNPPATIVWFTDGDKIVSVCDKLDTFNKEAGFMTCLLKKYLGKKEYYKLMDKYVYKED